MKLVLAPDKFKGSLTGLEFCDAVQSGLRKVIPDAELVFLPMADGGDGTIEVIRYYINGKWVTIEVQNPLFQSIQASYLYASDTKIAYIEMAEASGLKLLAPSEYDCMNATTFGTGQLIKDAMETGANEIILGIGGSATNDCGIGMATALGYRFLDLRGNHVVPVGKHLSEIVSIDDSQVQSGLNDVAFRIACDVTNPLFGKNGAAYVYAKQKGANANEVKALDKGLRTFSRVLDEKFKVKSQSILGGGAAGGMGVASKLFLNGELISGIELLKQVAQFEKKVENAHWIITGEGKLDHQTLSGKTIKGIIDIAKQKQIKVAAFCGILELDDANLNALGISYVDAVMNHASNIDEAMKHSAKYVSIMAEAFAKGLKGR